MKKIARTLLLLFFIIPLASCGGEYTKIIERDFQVDTVDKISLSHYLRKTNTTENLDVDEKLDIEYVFSLFKSESVKETPISEYKTSDNDCIEIYDVTYFFSDTSLSDYKLMYYVYDNTDGTVVYPNGEAYSFYGNAKCNTYDKIKEYFEAKNVSLESLYPWISELKLEDIQYIFFNDYASTVSPTYSNYAMNTYYKANGDKDIEKGYNFIKNAVVTKATDPFWDGVGEEALVFDLKDGTRHVLSQIANGFYVDGMYYEYQDFISFSTYYANSFLFYCNFDIYKNGVSLDIEFEPMKKAVFTANLYCDYVQQDKYLPYIIKNGDDEIHIIDDTTFYTLVQNKKTFYGLLNGDTFTSILAY